MDVIIVLSCILYIILCIVILVKFFQLCDDTRKIKEILISHFNEDKDNVGKPKEVIDSISLDKNPFPDVSDFQNAQKVRIGSFGICTFINESPIGKFNYITEKGQHITLLAKDVENLVKPL